MIHLTDKVGKGGRKITDIRLNGTKSMKRERGPNIYFSYGSLTPKLPHWISFKVTLVPDEKKLTRENLWGMNLCVMLKQGGFWGSDNPQGI